MTDKQNFIKAIENDQYAELELSENLVLITDYEFDGTFMPYIVDLSDNHNTESIDHILEENDITDIFLWDILEYDSGNDVYYPIVTKCEYENLNLSVWD